MPFVGPGLSGCREITWPMFSELTFQNPGLCFALDYVLPLLWLMLLHKSCCEVAGMAGTEAMAQILVVPLYLFSSCGVVSWIRGKGWGCWVRMHPESRILRSGKRKENCFLREPATFITSILIQWPCCALPEVHLSCQKLCQIPPTCFSLGFVIPVRYCK